jgi:hypothetical protein
MNTNNHECFGTDLISQMFPSLLLPAELHLQAYAVVLDALAPEPFPSGVQSQPTAVDLQPAP